VPTTNTISERDFAVLDLLVRNKPAAHTSTYESLIMWMNNGTTEWLQSPESFGQGDVDDKGKIVGS
jgi:hypothetical protein